MEPKLQIEQRCDRIEQAIKTMAWDLVNAGLGFNAHDAQGIERILDGEETQVTPTELHLAHDIAAAHHEAYKRLAPNYGHTPTPVTWEEVAEPRKSLLVAVIADLLDNGVIKLP